MKLREDGGPAFPHDNQELGDKHRIAQTGMTLRDYFAAKAIDRMICKCEDRDGGWDPVSVAVGCYAVADAMLAERAIPHDAETAENIQQKGQ